MQLLDCNNNQRLKDEAPTSLGETPSRKTPECVSNLMQTYNSQRQYFTTLETMQYFCFSAPLTSTGATTPGHYELTDLHCQQKGQGSFFSGQRVL